MVYTPEGFIPWAGGACPVGPLVRVDVIFRAGGGFKGARAHSWVWVHHPTCPHGDIVAYRVLDPVREMKRQIALCEEK